MSSRNDTAEVGRILRKYREANDLTQVQLAARMGMTQQAVSQLERGLFGVGVVRTLMALSRELNINPAEITAPFFSAGSDPEANDGLQVAS